MNADLQNFLSGMAKCAGLTIEYPEGSPISLCGYPDDETRFVNAGQPDSELIFAILQNIGLAASVTQEFRFPRYLNRLFENERIGQLAYKVRRTLRQKFNLRWRADLWALYVYSLLPCQNEFQDFLGRHPEKKILMPIVYLTNLKSRLLRMVQRA